MTPKNLFNIILKIFGLFFLRDVVFIIPSLFSSIPYLTNTNNFGGSQFSSGEILPFILTLIAIAVYGFIVYQLLFNTNKTVDKLKLTRGFDQKEFSFHMSSPSILAISLIVIGGIILINEIPSFCKNVFWYFQQRKFEGGTTNPNFSYVVMSGVKVLIGLLIIGERKRIVEFIEKRQGKKEEDENEIE